LIFLKLTPLTKAIASLRENQTDQPYELAADHFLNWVYGTYNPNVFNNCEISTDKDNCTKITTFWEGGANPVDSRREGSPGIDIWLSIANFRARELLQNLTLIVKNL
jgi:hypothetical protein